jgi:hypothetical protein
MCFICLLSKRKPIQFYILFTSRIHSIKFQKNRKMKKELCRRRNMFYINLFRELFITLPRSNYLNGINLVERKNIESAVNSTSVHSFINTA